MWDIFEKNIDCVATVLSIDKDLLRSATYAFIEHATLHTYIPEIDDLVIDMSEEACEFMVHKIEPFFYHDFGVAMLVGLALSKMGDDSNLWKSYSASAFADSLWLACCGEEDVDFSDQVIEAVKEVEWAYRVSWTESAGLEVLLSTRFS